jgi:pilus assembly protein CpaE
MKTEAREMNRIPAVVIGRDGSLVADLKRYGEKADALDVVLEFGIPFRELTELQMKKIRLASPRLVFIDLDDDARTGCKVARYLADANPETQIVAAGTKMSPEILVEAMRAGVSEYLEKPLSQESLDEAVDRLSQKLPNGSRGTTEEGGKVLLFFGAKGGAGSTTVATNFAIQLRRQTGERVLIVDLDLPLGEVALYLGVEPRYGIVDLARNLHRIDEDLLGSYITSHASGVDVLSAPFDPDEGREIGAEETRRILEFLRGVYDYIVVDASNSLDSRTIASLPIAEEIFVVAQIDVPSLRNIQRARRVLKRVAPERPLRVVINRYHAGGDITLKDVERSLGLEVYSTISNDYGAVLYSINSGEPLAMNAPSACVREMGELVGRITGVQREPDKKSRWAPRRRTGKKRERSMPATVLVGAQR